VADPVAPILSRVAEHGRDAVSFQALESVMRHWHDAPPPEGTAAVVAYVDTGTAWVAAGSPLAAAPDLAVAAARFVASARAAGRRAAFFATEVPHLLGEVDAVFLGEQPVFEPGDWPRSLAASRRLREQLRRARAKGVRVRAVTADELAPGAPLRRAVEELAAEWLRSRRMEPMGFLVALEPFHAASEHRYVVAERDGELVAFLSAVPIYARRGWLVEDTVRSSRAPNGTSEALLDCFMRMVADSEVVTLGLAPLSGAIATWQHVARFVSRPLYDFRGVRAFKERLRPSRWEPVWLALPRGELKILHLTEALRAFARGSLVRFGLRTVARHPGGPPWALALPLAPWTALLAVRAGFGLTSLLGWSRGVLAAWSVFDALLCIALFRVAMRPTRRRLLAVAAAAATDAAVSLAHLATTGIGATPSEVLLRLIQTVAPVVGTAALVSAAARAGSASSVPPARPPAPERPPPCRVRPRRSAPVRPGRGSARRAR